MEKIVALCKRRGFIYQGSEIYGGLAGTWDFGPYGLALKNNIKRLWWNRFVEGRDDMYGIDAAILMNPKAWEASGHTETFTDPLVECSKCKHRFRADHVEGDACPDCGGSLGEPRQFNMMFETKVGALDDSASVTYLRPETAGGIFVNFKNIMDSFHPRLPFGIAQIGKAFRNEITPRDFIFRTREFEQMEVEYFVKESDWERAFDEWREVMNQFIMNDLGLPEDSVHELEVAESDLAHYSKRTIDFEFEYPFGRKELFGLAYRTDFDLSQHRKVSSEKIDYFDDQTGERFIPHVIEPSLGVDRAFLAVLVSSFREDTLGDDTRTYLALPKQLAPIKAAVFPLLKNKPELVAKAREIYEELKKDIPQIMWDDNGNVGKRYRRQDEIGTPYCITVDFETLEGKGVTIRDRDTGEQERISEGELLGKIIQK